MLRVKVTRHPGDLDPALMLGSALYQIGDLQGSAETLRSAQSQHPQNPQLLMLLARTEARSGNASEALELFARAQALNPGDATSWQVAAALAAEIRDWAELLRIAEAWTHYHPQSLKAWQALSRAHFEESRFEPSLAAMDRVIELDPANASHFVSAGRIAIAALDYDLARRYLHTAQAQTQSQAAEPAELSFALCRLHHLTGELELAEQYCLKAIAASPGYAPAYIELGILREGRLEDGEIEVVNRLFQETSVHAENRVMLGLTLGDALDRKGKTDAAFDAWDQANAINHEISRREGYFYRPEEFAAEPELLAALFAEPLTVSEDSPSGDYPNPVFVVGMPRSGTTLLESILASHSKVIGGGELPTLFDIYEELLRVSREQGIEAARELLHTQISSWRVRYLAALPESGGAGYVVDKQPLNFRAMGLIKLLFPESAVIYIQREPLDVGLSIYRHKFTKSWPCANRLQDIGHYYGVHLRLIEFWRMRHPGYIYSIEYHKLVTEQESCTRALLQEVGLEFEPACLAPHQTRREVATFSAIQVQNPVSAAFSNRAAPYVSRLAPLQQALVDAGFEFPGKESESGDP